MGKFEAHIGLCADSRELAWDSHPYSLPSLCLCVRAHALSLTIDKLKKNTNSIELNCFLGN